MDETSRFCREKLPSAIFTKDLIELIFVQPYSKVSFLVEAGLGGRQTSAKYLSELEKIGVLQSEKVGRERIYVNTKLLKLLIAGN